MNEMESELTDSHSDSNECCSSFIPTTFTPCLETPNKKVKQYTEKRRFRWTTEKVETLIDCLNKQKCQFEFKDLDFETDLISLYSNIQKWWVKFTKVASLESYLWKKLQKVSAQKSLPLKKFEFKKKKFSKKWLWKN